MDGNHVQLEEEVLEWQSQRPHAGQFECQKGSSEGKGI